MAGGGIRMDCRTAQLLLTFARPKASELGAREAEALNRHLTACAACAALARGQSQIEHQLGVAMRDVPLPVDLRQRLLTRLAEDRREWYTHLPRRHPRWAAAAAALLLLAVGFVVYAALRPPSR